MDKEYFKQYHYLERNHWWFVGRLEILKQTLALQIKPEKPLKILNVGVATGLTSTMLAEFGEVTSVEYDADCCEFLRTQGFEVTQASMTELPYADGSFDLVCAFDVVEHIKDDVTAIAEAKRVLTPEGFLYITVPMHMHLWSDHDVINHHERRYSKVEIENLVSNKFSIKYSTFFNSILYIPVLLARKISNLTKTKDRKVQSDFEHFKTGLVNNMLLSILRIEKKWLKTKTFMNGVSYLIVAKKIV